jgi:hypothetical protein
LTQYFPEPLLDPVEGFLCRGLNHRGLWLRRYIRRSESFPHTFDGVTFFVKQPFYLEN